MKLTELTPRWLSEPGRHGQGLTFQCPCCVNNPPKRVRLALAFANPIDGGSVLPHFDQPGMKRCHDAIWGPHGAEPKGWRVVPPGHHWRRVGDTFETLTLTPSVDASASGHWHGFLTGGAIQ